MPHDVITFKESVLPKEHFGGHDMVLRHQHEFTAGPNQEVVKTKHDAMDQANCRWMMGVLMKHYPGRPWFVKHDGAQGMAYVSIPILMGFNKVWAINLKTDPLSEDLLMRCGGQILERYRMSRGRFVLSEFLEAREKHSALVIPSRKVPE